jgi:hypothetical protein
MDWTEVEARVRDDERQSLESFIKGVEEAPTLYRPMTTKAEVVKDGEDVGLMRFVASTEDKDRAGDIIRQNWELGNFKDNPVYMWGHDYSKAPIGNVPRIWIENKKASTGGPVLMNTVRFDEGDAFAMEVKGKFERGMLKAQSVGFRPLELNIMRDVDGHFEGYEFTKSELLEISAVSIPMNQMALRKAAELAGSAPVIFFMDSSSFALPVTEPVALDISDIEKRLTDVEGKILIADTSEVVVEEPEVQKTETTPEPKASISTDVSAELVGALRAVRQENN